MAESSASIIHVVAWGTRLSLNLYDFAIANPASTREANTLAKSVSLFALMLKQVGTSLKEDTTIPSGEAFETVQDIVLQANDVFAAIQAAVPDKSKRDGVRFENGHDGVKERGWSDVVHDRLRYMLPYVRSLNSTLAVMLQAFYTVRVIAWSRSRQDRLPPTAADAVANERAQLEVLIIEQQLLLLDVFDAFSTYQQTREEEGVAHQQDSTPPPSKLSKYRDESIGEPQARRPLAETSSLVRRASVNFSNVILARWTQLKALERRLSLTDSEEDKPKPAERRRSYQPTVESVASDSMPPTARNSPELVKSPNPQRPPSARTTLPAPIPTSGVIRSTGPFSPKTGAFSPSAGPYSPSTGPFSPGPSYSASPASTAYFPGSPRRAAAATTGFKAPPPRSASFHGTFPPRPPPAPDTTTTTKVEEETADGLDIPWRLWLQSNRWDFVDDKVVSTNAAVPPEQAFTDRAAWTEIMQKWVRREALEEARYSFNQVQKEVSEGGRTRFETCFCIGRPLTYVSGGGYTAHTKPK
ncbi:uncharacterized protein K452DRAFT_287392 [Aplosporella prunicola CBS 121167]|uniref:Fungal N-terminal domain-containing protein n=1 Tax=Aplosporella prunicola CBS 121167 TaxID=1176127 RepID=A0A6A6BFZ5_9PEZI|nr:uncharacterized protein K452DRAFT_287392 [Aplosporella prunicola CBS 121167]KAF2142174.1 hypothetical protein K452DRAFT_287392 [Aplosporella prunicola CBS 121167]